MPQVKPLPKQIHAVSLKTEKANISDSVGVTYSISQLVVFTHTG